MNALETAIQEAFAHNESQKHTNKAYLEFIKANFIIPVEKEEALEPKVLFFEEQGKYYLPVFTNREFFAAWADDIKDSINVLKLSGVDLLKGIGENVIISLNIGSSLYKEFNESEINRLKSVVMKFKK